MRQNLKTVLGKDRRYHNMPESLRAFCKIVSFTAAKTRRIFVVSVACVKLSPTSETSRVQGSNDLLRIKIELSAINLIEPPE
jgi:hypothetical protein